jgi:hypothetical protein
MPTIRLPSAVYDDSLDRLISVLGEVEQFPIVEEVLIDFQDARFYVPSAMAALLSVVSRWNLGGRPVTYLNCESCEAFGYFQRMDFFALSGIQLPESFKRHDPDGRFVPLCEVTADSRGNVDTICSRLAGCVFPELAESVDPELTGPFDLVEYAASELINNVLQHSKGRGYVAAQAYAKSGLVRLSVSDSGIGIRQSFSENRPPFWDEAMTDLDSVRTALQPKVSSKTHLGGGWGQGVVNAGVGLSMLKAIAKHTDGLFTLISGSGLYQHNHMERRRLPSEFQLTIPYHGTICALQLSKQKLGNLQQILQSAKIDLGLLSPDRNFDRLFE